MGGIAAPLKGHALVALDTNCVIHYIEDAPGADRLEDGLFEPLSRGKLRALFPAVCLMELLVGPMRSGNAAVAREYYARLLDFPNLSIAGVTAEVALRAAEIRARHGLKTPDALVAATALEAGATALVTADRGFAALAAEIDVVVLDELLAL